MPPWREGERGRENVRRKRRERIERHNDFVRGIDPTVTDTSILDIAVIWVNKLPFLLTLISVGFFFCPYDPKSQLIKSLDILIYLFHISKYVDFPPSPHCTTCLNNSSQASENQSLWLLWGCSPPTNESQVMPCPVHWLELWWGGLGAA